MLRRLCLVLALFLAVDCAYGQRMATSTTHETGQIVFSEDVLPLLQEKFAPLLTEDEGLQVDSWQHLIEGSEHGAVLIPYDAEHSLIVQVAEQAATDPVGSGGAPSEEEITLLRQWIEQGAKNDAGEVPYADAGQLLYVANEGEALVSVIDMENNLVIRTVDLTEFGFSDRPKPHDTAVEPDGSHWYVSLISENRVLKFNRENELVGQAEFEVPGMLALDAASNRLYVGRSMSAVNPPHSIGIIDTETMTVEEVGVFYPRPHAIAVDPQGEYVYSASLAQNRVATVDPATSEVELTDLQGPLHTLVQFDVAPDGEAMVAGGQMSGEVFFFDITAAPATVTDTLMIGGQPWHPSYTPDGQYVYFPQKTANAVSVIDAETHTVEAVIEGPAVAQPHGSAARPDGRYVYVSGTNVKGTYTPRYELGDATDTGTIVVIDTRTNEVAKILDVGDTPKGLGAP